MRSFVLPLAITMFVLVACGQPNASDTPGAAGPPTANPSPTAAPSPTALATPAVITTPCTKGQTKTTIDGLRINDSKCGTGPEATRGSVIEVKYVAKLATGKVFYSTAKHGNKPFKTPLGVGAVIPGWDEGIPGMRVGGVRLLTVPPALGFGQTGAGPIPPHSTLVFTIKLVGVTPGPSPS
jgi:FKBP-type peptidyl-prolyl cis-trans isomerase